MSGLEPAAQLLRRVGAVRAEDVIRYLADACDALAEAGPTATVSLDCLEVSEAPEEKSRLGPRSFTSPPQNPHRAQVSAVAALGYELLKGMPPPASPSEGDWLGERPELVRLLAPALLGTGAGDVGLLAHQLRTLGRADTLAREAPTAGDGLPLEAKPGPATERAGEVLGAWELVSRLGSGGMGDVYRARHTRLGREVAVKILKPQFAANPQTVQRFFQEAKVVNEINHPHIVEIHDFVEEPGRVYCVMELLPGQTLVDLVSREGSLGVQRSAALFAQVCDALEAAHRRGVIHRDVKPDNIFVSVGPDGKDFARVLDFGIARRMSGAPRTLAGSVLGTANYMSPEQAAGRPVDARADVFSVGMALHEALSGSFRDHPGALKPLRETGKGEPVPVALTQLLVRCTAIEPAHRPRSAGEVRDALEAIARAPVLPRPSTDALEVAAGLRPPSRRRWWVGALLAALGLGAVGVGWSFSTRQAAVFAPPDPNAVMKLPPVPAPVGTRPAAPPAPLAKRRPKPVAEKAAPPEPPPVDPLAPRAQAVRRRYDDLLVRFGAAQLTRLEKAAVTQALDDASAGRPPGLADSLKSAEDALDAAERRLAR